jgi:hypothetical protein
MGVEQIHPGYRIFFIATYTLIYYRFTTELRQVCPPAANVFDFRLTACGCILGCNG